MEAFLLVWPEPPQAWVEYIQAFLAFPQESPGSSATPKNLQRLQLASEEPALPGHGSSVHW